MAEQKRVAFYTLGCKVNQYETDAMEALFINNGYAVVPFTEMADVYIVNSCTVTATSDQKTRQMLSRAHKRNPQATIAVVGCYAQRAPEEVKALPGVTLVLGTKDRSRIVELCENGEAASIVTSIRTERGFEEMPSGLTALGRTRAQLKIQDGCDRYCTYCIIPYARGPVRSRSLENIRAELLRMAQAGFLEVVLTGIHLMSYGKDMKNGESLIDAIQIAEDTPGIARVRLGSLEPALINDGFAKALAGMPKLCRQFHLSLQSGSETVLARMHRRYTPEEYARAVDTLRAAMPDCAITTDVIAGFPGETEAEHQETLAFVQRIGFSRMHVFPYSRREGTVAADMPGQVEKSLRESRAKELIAAGEIMTQAYLISQQGSIQSVLAEQAEGGFAEGYTGSYIRARFPGGEADAGKIVRVRLLAAKNGVMTAERI